MCSSSSTHIPGFSRNCLFPRPLVLPARWQSPSPSPRPRSHGTNGVTSVWSTRSSETFPPQHKQTRQVVGPSARFAAGPPTASARAGVKPAVVFLLSYPAPLDAGPFGVADRAELSSGARGAAKVLSASCQQRETHRPGVRQQRRCLRRFYQCLLQPTAASRLVHVHARTYAFFCFFLIWNPTFPFCFVVVAASRSTHLVL